MSAAAEVVWTLVLLFSSPAGYAWPQGVYQTQAQCAAVAAHYKAVDPLGEFVCMPRKS